MNRAFTGFEPEAMDLLVRYDWRGNVRELANAVERALVVGRGPLVRAEDLPMRLNEQTGPPVGDSLADVEKAQIQIILERTGGNITRAAEILRIDRVTLYNKIKKYNLRS
jgi:DNA-binding NtrC family response regulator